MELRGKVVVITGASRGLGAGLAAEMTRHGIHLGLCARTAPALANSETVLAAQCDVTDGKAMDAFTNVVIERFGGIDLWINNAGVLDPIAPLRELETEAFRRPIDINLTGVFHGTRAFVRHLHEAGTRGVLINISSGAGRKGYAGWSAYCAGKGAVDRLTEAGDRFPGSKNQIPHCSLSIAHCSLFIVNCPPTIQRSSPTAPAAPARAIFPVCPLAVARRRSLPPAR